MWVVEGGRVSFFSWASEGDAYPHCCRSKLGKGLLGAVEGGHKLPASRAMEFVRETSTFFWWIKG